MRRGENRSTQGKTSHSREENQQTVENLTWATLVGGQCSHHYATTALQSKVASVNVIKKKLGLSINIPKKLDFSSLRRDSVRDEEG